MQVMKNSFESLLASWFWCIILEKPGLKFTSQKPLHTLYSLLKKTWITLLEGLHVHVYRIKFSFWHPRHLPTNLTYHELDHTHKNSLWKIPEYKAKWFLVTLPCIIPLQQRLHSLIQFRKPIQSIPAKKNEAGLVPFERPSEFKQKATTYWFLCLNQGYWL